MVAYPICKSIRLANQPKAKLFLLTNRKSVANGTYTLQCDYINHSRFNKHNITSMIDKLQAFIELTIGNESNTCQTITILKSAVIMIVFINHANHIPYLLHFLINFNLYGMNYIYIDLRTFRQLLLKANDIKQMINQNDLKQLMVIT